MAAATTDALSSKLEEHLSDIFTQLQTMACDLKIPCACIYVYSHRATLVLKFGTDLIPNADTDASRTDAPPHPPREGEPASGDKGTTIVAPADQMVFGVGSLSKILIALLYIRLIEVEDKHKIHKDLRWDTKIYKLLNQLRMRNGKATVPPLEGDLTIEDALVHDGFPALASFLLGYGGRPITSTEDFLMYAAVIAKREGRKNPQTTEYSNCNTALLVALIVELYGKTFVDVIHRDLLEPLSMNRTSFRKAELDNWDGFVQKGYRISADLNEISPVELFKYLNEDDLSSAVFGCHSCVGDFGKLLTAIFQALEEKSDSFFTPRMAKCLLQFSDQDRCRTFFGQRGSLDSDLLGSDSLDLFLRPEGHGPSYRLGKDTLHGKITEPMVQYKGGTIDGYTSSVYFLRERLTYVVAFCNGLGVLDYADRACHVILQKLFELQPEIKLHEQLLSDIPIVQKRLRAIEAKDRDIPVPNPEIKTWAGIYQHTLSNHRIEISDTGYLTKSGSGGMNDRVRCGVVDKALRIYRDENPLAVDRRTHFAGASFSKQLSKNNTEVLFSDQGEVYKKNF